MQQPPRHVRWVSSSGASIETGGGSAVVPQHVMDKIFHGDQLGTINDLQFRDPNHFIAGELHHHCDAWEKLLDHSPNPQQLQVLRWIQEKVSVSEYFRPFHGHFKGQFYDTAYPPPAQFSNNPSCHPFAEFIRTTLLAGIQTGAISLLGRVGEVSPPYLILPLTVEPMKPRLCHDARFLNLWMTDAPFKLDNLTHLPRYVPKDTYQTVLDDKSGYDHILLSEDSRTYFGIQWGGWYLVYNTLPFGWKISPFVYHTTGLLATNFFRSFGIPCSLYIDDRHNGQLQVDLYSGAYFQLPTLDERNLAATNSAIFIVAYYLVQLGYFLGLAKSTLIPVKVVPFLGFLSESALQVFHLIRGIEQYIAIAEQLKINLKSGYLFRPTNQQGAIVNAAFTSSAAEARLRTYLKEMGSDDGETLHGFRSGCAITLALSEVELSEVMDHVGWTQRHTALYYLQLAKVVNPAGASS